ncbi:hypothetical protein QMM98_17445, partial [Leptospira santarosai]|nr:hypothetical protein [Leptospira santarosai]
MLCICKITRFVLVTNPKPTVGITESAFYSSLCRYRFKKTMLGTIKQYKRRLSAGLERITLFVYPTLVLIIGSVLFKRKIKRAEVF